MAKNVVTLDLNNTDYSFRPYGVCNTGAATAAKTVSINDFTLCSGATVLVKFTNGNTVASPTLNVNNTGAKSIQFGNDLFHVFQNNDTYEFVYNGSNWDLIGVTGHLYSCDTDKNATFPANLTSTGALSVKGNTTLGDAVTDTVNVAGPTTLNNNLTVKGNTTLGDAATDTVNVAGPTTLNNNLTVKGNTTLGDAATDTVNVAGPTTLNNNLTVKGNTTLGDAATDTVTVNSKATFKNGLILSPSNFNNTIQIANTDFPAASVKLFMGNKGDFVIRSTFSEDESASDLRWNKTSLIVGGEKVLTGTDATDAEITNLFNK